MLPLTHALPKPLTPFADMALIDHGLEMMQELVDDLYVTVGYMGDALARHVIEKGVTAVFNTNNKPNGWWVNNTLLSQIDEPVLVSTCDNPVSLDFQRLLKEYRAAGLPAAMIVPVDTDAPDGDRLEIDGSIVRNVGPNVSQGPLASGLQILRPARVKTYANGAADFREIWSALSANDQLMTSEIRPTRWAAIDSLKDVTEKESLWKPRHNNLAATISHET